MFSLLVKEKIKQYYINQTIRFSKKIFKLINNKKYQVYNNYGDELYKLELKKISLKSKLEETIDRLSDIDIKAKKMIQINLENYIRQTLNDHIIHRNCEYRLAKLLSSRFAINIKKFKKFKDKIIYRFYGRDQLKGVVRFLEKNYPHKITSKIYYLPINSVRLTIYFPKKISILLTQKIQQYLAILSITKAKEDLLKITQEQTSIQSNYQRQLDLLLQQKKQQLQSLSRKRRSIRENLNQNIRQILKNLPQNYKLLGELLEKRFEIKILNSEIREDSNIYVYNFYGKDQCKGIRRFIKRNSSHLEIVSGPYATPIKSKLVYSLFLIPPR